MLANGTIDDGEYIKMVKQATDQEGENQQRKQSAVTRTMEALGQQQAVEMRDGDADRYNGKGVLKAVDAVNFEIFRSNRRTDLREQIC